MAHFTYLGDSEAVTFCGIHFPQGVAVEVVAPGEPMDYVLGKLRGNRFFVESFDGVEVLMPEEKPKRKYIRKAP